MEYFKLFQLNVVKVKGSTIHCFLCWWNVGASSHTVCLLCGSEDMLKVEGMDVKLSEPITAGHLISAARSGNSKAEAVLNKGERTELFYRFQR